MHPAASLPHFPGSTPACASRPPIWPQLFLAPLLLLALLFAVPSVQAQNGEPSISSQPQGIPVGAGGTYSFNVIASGTGSLSYQWFKNGSAISGATSPMYRLSRIQSVDSGTYTVKVANSLGSLTSTPSSLKVYASVDVFVSAAGNDTTGNGTAAAPYATIQKGISVAANGQSVVVLAGTYSGVGNRDLQLLGKQIRLASVSGPASTVIDLGGNRALTASSTETRDTLVQGFTFKNGFVSSGADWSGDGIVAIINSASLTLQDCVFSNNETKATYVTTWTGIVRSQSNADLPPQVLNCLFYSNKVGGGGWTAVGGGGGGVVVGCRVDGCTVANNEIYSSVADSGNYGGGFRIPIAGRVAPVTNTILWGNSIAYSPAPWAGTFNPYFSVEGSLVSYTVSDGVVLNSGVGLSSANPLFTNAAGGNYALLAGSPARNNGDPYSTLNPDGGRSDMGWRADRFWSPTAPSGPATPLVKLLQDVTSQTTGLTGYSSASLREVANANGAAAYYLSTDNDVLKLYSQAAPFQFTDVSAKFLPAGFKWTPGSRLLVADFDNNGSQDLVLWEPTGLRVLLNTIGTFKEASLATGLNASLAELHKTLLDVLAADLDGDGDLDLVFRYAASGTAKPGRVACVYNDALRNAEGRQAWTPNVAAFARVADVLSLSYGYGGLFAADLDLDGKVDLIVGEKASTLVNDNYQQRPLHLFINQGSGAFEETVTPLSGMADYGFALADYQGTGRLDLIQGSSDWPWAGSYPHAYWSSATGVFEKSASPVLERVSGDYHFVLSTADFDLDGRSDAFWSRLGRYAGGLFTGPLRMWKNTGPKTFQDMSSDWGFTFPYPAGSSDYSSTVADFDNDGAPDILINAAPWQASSQRLFRNTAAKAGANYLKIRLTGVASPRDGTGARIEVRTGSNVAVRYNSGTEQSNLPFGLGSAKTAELVKVYWPSGKVSEAKNVPGNQWLEVVEPAVPRFEVVRGSFTWPEVVADAAKRGGRPAVLSTAELQQQGNALQTGPDAVSLWIGLSDEAVNGTFRWLDGTATAAFSNWAPSEPNDFFGPASENNVEMLANGKWNDLPGGYRLSGYLLERTSGALRITKQPESVVANFAASFSLSVTAEGSGKLGYQWLKDGVEIAGATSGSLTVSALTRSAVGAYWVVVSEGGNKITSEKALVTMANPPPIPTDSLLAWWPLDGNAIDQGPNAIHGTLTGPSAGPDRFNRATRSLSFAGSRTATAFVNFGAADKLRIPGDSTVSLWVRFADSDTPTPRILQFGAGQFELSTSTGRGARAVQYTVGGATLKGARLLETGRWHHIVAVRRGGRGALYVNSRLDAEGPMAAVPAFGSTLSLGRNTALSDGAFAGGLDELRVYGRALSVQEIEALGGQPDGGDIVPPVVVQDPKSLIVDAGVAAQFAVRASGSRGVLYYQWLKDGVEIPGATAAVLTLPRVEARHTGAYACEVSDGYANVTSATATLGVTGVNSGLWQGLVGHWKLDGNALDSSGFANHAAMRGTSAAAADRFGSATGAFSFGGNGAYFEVGDRAGFDLNKSDATLSAWVKTSSAAESWLLSKMDPSQAGGIGLGVGAAATMASQAVTYFKLSQLGGGYQRIQAVDGVNIVAGNVYEVSAVMPADFVWSFGDVFEFYPASSYTAPFAGIIEAVTPSSQAKATQLVGDRVEFRFRFKSTITATEQYPQFTFYRGPRKLVEIANIELKNITTGELLTPALTSPTLTTQWLWDSAEAVKFRTATIGVSGGASLGARTVLWGNGAVEAKRASDSVTLGDNKWHLVTSVYDRKGKMSLYVDGTKRVETNITAADIAVSNAHPLRIGSAVGATSFTGTLDDVRWYNRALSEADVLALYRQSEIVDTDGDGLSDAYEYGWGRYELVAGAFTWAEAKAHAEAKGGHLATITSEAEWQAIKTVVGPAVSSTVLWLGGTDEGAEGRWRWVTGEKWSFAKWGRTPANDQEPNGATTENVLNLFPGDYLDRANGFIWNDSNNVARCGYLFERGYFTDATKWDTDGDGLSDSDEIKNGTDPTNADSGLTGTIYRFVPGTLSWTDAKADAEAKGGHLGTITSASEWGRVTAQIGADSEKPMWLGGYQPQDAISPSVGWKWVTGEDFTYTNWMPIEPNGGEGFKGYLNANARSQPGVPNWSKNGGWYDTGNVVPPPYLPIEGYLLEIEPRVQNQYSVVEGRFTWKEAKADAERRGGHLVTVSSATEWDTIRLALGDKFNQELWLGGTSEDTVGQWKWVTGEPFTFSVWAPGQPDSPSSERYLEKKDSNFWSGQWNDLSNAASGTVGYILEIERTALQANLAITTQPVPVTVSAIGGTASFSVVASGLAPLTYQWRKDGVVIPGDDQAALSLDNVGTSLVGKYSVVVSDASGKSVTSNEATLAITGFNSGVWSGPVITQQPLGLRLPFGGTGVLRVVGTSTSAISYQWQKDGTNIGGATGQELSLTNATEALQGSYRVRVSNAAGAVLSDSVLVDVLDQASNVTLYVAKTGSDTTGDGTQTKPFVSIGRAVKEAASGARILVGPGTYAERVEYAGKSLRIHSSDGAGSTVLQGAAGNTVVYIDAAASNSELRGFRITGGAGRPSPSSFGFDYYGGGVHCATTALISDCIFEANGKGTARVNAATFGGAIYSVGGSLRVVNCLIFDNYAWASGGATFTESGSIEFDRCTVADNKTTAFRGTQAGLAVGNGGRMLVRNSIVWGNSGSQAGSQLGAFGWPYNVGTEIAVEYSLIQAPNDGGGAQSFRNGTGNLSSDPTFADAAAKNYALRTGSPALDKAAPGLPKEKDGTAADMGWRADRFGVEPVTPGSQLFTDVTDSVRLPQHELLAEIDSGLGTATDRLVRVADGSLQLWRVTGGFGYRDVMVSTGLPKGLLGPLAGGHYAVGDVDNNGAQDLVVWDASGLRVFQNTAGVFKAATVSVALNKRAVELFLKARGSFTLADLDSDGDLDVVFNYEDTGENPGHIAQFTNGATLDGVSGRRVWLAGDGFSGVQDVMTVPWRKPHFSVTDSNGDGLSDLVVLETNGSWPSDTHVSHKAHIYLNRVGGTGAAGGFGVTTVGDSAFVSFPHDAVMNTGAQATIEAWVRGTSVNAADDARVTRYSDGKEHKELVVSGDGSVSAIYAWGLWPTVKAPAGSVKMDGQWHHVAFNRHVNGAWEIYVDGKAVGSGIGNGIADRIIGTTTTTGVRAKGGLEIDEVRWSNVDRYNGNFSPERRFETDANAVLLVHFDEGGGTRVQDSGLKKQVGTMPNGASWKPQGIRRTEGLARYSIVSGKYTFAEARADAEARGGHLLTVSSESEWQAVLGELTARATSEDLWIGAVYENGQWGWVGLERFDYSKWEGGAPGSGTGGVYSAKESGSWKTAAAGSKLGYLLEWESLFEEVHDAGLPQGSEFSSFLSADVDGDGYLDLVNGSSDWPSQSSPKVFYSNGNGDGTYRQEKAPFVGSDRYYHHVASVADIDLDGRMDGWWSGLHNFSDLQARLWRGIGGGAFAEVGKEWGVDVGLASGNLSLSGYLSDWDGDGDLDLVARATGSGSGRYKVYRNNAADRGNRWLGVRLVGVASPRDGTGARVTVVTGDRSETQYVGNVSSAGSSLGTQLVFGLGGAPSASMVLVTWPNGLPQSLYEVPAGQVVEIRQSAIQGPDVPDWLRFTEQPVGRTVAAGTLVVFSAKAIGSGTISYQWLKGGVPITGGTASTYRIASAALASVGDYQVVASNGAGKVLSAVARLEVGVAPSIVSQPRAVSVVAGADAVLSVDAVGTAALSYQWLKGTVAVTGGTGRTLTLKAVGAGSLGSYTVRVSNPAGSVTSTAAAVSLLTPVQITKQPANVTVTEGAALALSVTATGSPVLKYQWYRDSGAIQGGTAASLTVAKAAALNAGSYSVTVSNAAGEVSSAMARVVVNQLPRVLNVEELLSVKEGAAFELVANATGAVPLSYVWSKNGTVLSGKTAATLSVPSATLLDSGSYTVQVKNAVGVTVGNIARVSVQALPQIVTQPVNLDAVEGSSAVLSVGATGAQPLSYQWYKDGTELNGQTASALSLSPLSATTHGGSYKVQVSNTVGRVFSNTAVVTVQPGLKITTQPASAEFALGARATLSVVASGSAPLTYQWYKDGALLPEATQAALVVASVERYSIGDYAVVVKDRFGNAVRSEAAALSVSGEAPTYWKGLMAHWKFSNDTRDGTPFRNHGDATNVQTVSDRFGVANSALRFSGKLNPLSKALVSQNVTVPHSDSLQPGEKYTVVVWAKPEFAGENLAEVNPFMLGKRAGKDLRDVSYGVSAGFGSGSLNRINGGGGLTGFVSGGTATLVDGQWQMYALTFDGGSLTLYRNGAKVAVEAARSSAAAPNTGPLRIGSGSGDGYQEWFGCLDDIRLYNKVLSEAEVTALYTAENTPPVGMVAPAAIVVQPVGYKVPEGGPLTLLVEASGGAPLAYQWKRDGVVLAGGTLAEYKIAGAAISDEGSYTVEVSNSVSSVTSVPAFVDVVPAVAPANRLYVSKTGNDATGSGTAAAPYLTIAKAVDAAKSGFQILVSAGTYAERVEYRGKTLAIESTNGPVETIIQAPAGNTAVFIDAAAVNSRLRGFKVAGGTGRQLSSTATTVTFVGGGVCILTSAVVQDCIIEGNGNPGGIRFKSQASFGGGVYSTGGTAVLINCLITGNHASEAGGAVCAERGTCELDRCTVYGNTVGTFNAQIGGLGVRDGGRLLVRNSIVRGNTGKQLGAMPFPNNKDTLIQLEYSNIEGGAVASQVASLKVGAGNGSGDPLFADVVAKNFALRAGSPALDAAAPGLPKETDGTAADMGYRQDRFGAKTGQIEGALFTDVTSGVVSRLPEHTLLALVDAGVGAKVDRLVRVVSGKETVVRLWRTSGDFAAVDTTVAAGLPLDLASGLLAVGDFDNNGAQDVASLSAAGLRVYLSTGGVFKAQTVSAAMVAQSKTLWTQNAAELEVADLNGDGLLDLVCNYTVAGAAQPGRIGAFLATGAADATGRRSWGTTGGFTEFKEVQSYAWAKPVFSLADVNGDGLTDLVVLETDGRSPEDTGSRRPVHVYTNRWKTNAASPFSEILNHGIVGGNELAKFQVVDVNGDGKLDLVNGSAAEGSVEATKPQWFEGAGDGTFTARTAAFTTGVAIGHRLFSEVDADLDGVLDPVWLGADGTKDVQVRLWRGKGAGALQDMTAEWGVEAGLGGGRLHLDGYFSDWDGDGSQDLVVRAWDDASTQSVYKVYRNQAAARGGKVVRVRLEGVRSPRDGQGAVIEVMAGGRKQVRYVGNLGEGYSVMKSFGLGPVATVEKITVRWPSGTVQEVTAVGSGPVLEIKETVVPTASVVFLRLPQSALVASGQPVSVACEALGVGSGTLTYQWHKDGVLLAGATKSSYDIAAMGAANVGEYTVRVGFGTASLVSPPARLEMAVVPTIVTQPQSVSLLAGQTARFSVGVSGTAPFTYQWYKGGSEIVGATNDSLSVADVGAGAVGAYTVKVTNGVGNVTSAVANLALATAPAITVQPAGGSFAVGAALVLTPTYTGTGPLGYQWYKDGALLVGKTTATLTLTPLALGSDGVYAVTVSNAFGSVDSAGAAVQVYAAPRILEQPVGVSVLVGQAFSLRVRTALGAAETYQWFKGTAAIAGATGVEYAVEAAKGTDAGSYTVKVTNLAGTVQSTAAVVAVNVAPSITTQPVGVEVKEGLGATLSVVAQGSATLTYRWQKNGVDIANATAASYVIKAAGLADAGFYSVRVSNGFGTVQSNEVSVSVLSLPRITQQPVGLTVAVDERVAFSVEAIGSGTLSYQWRKGVTAIAGATSTTYSIPTAKVTDAGAYTVVVSNAVGSVTSGTAALVVSEPPVILTQPVSRALNPGAALSLSVSAAGAAPLSYQWRKGDVAISGATAATYAVASAQAANEGVYTVVVSNPVGSTTSQAATVSFNTGVTITAQPVSLTVNPGSLATFSVSATGSAPFTYQWRKGGIAIPNATSSSYTIQSAAAADAASYDVVVGNTVDKKLSDPAKLTVNLPVEITTQPVGRMAVAGSAVELKVVATGTDPKRYQWSRNGVALAGGTAAVYAVGSVQAVDAGTYTVTVSNMVNSVVSTPVEVRLEQAPTIQTQPSSLTVNPGTLVTLSVSASGTAPLRYQWQKEGVNLSGGTASSYVIASAKTTDAGTYTVVVSNNAGSVTSAPAVVGLNTPAAITTQPVGATLAVGTLHTLRVLASGTAPLSYQWYKGGVAITGGTQESYTLQSAQLTDSGTYTVKVSNMVNAVTSAAANVSVAEFPVIVTQPSSLTVNPGTLATLSVGASASGPLTYQWMKDGVTVSGGTASSYKITSVKATDAGTYTVVVSNAVGSVTSVPAELVVNVPLSITTQPVSQSVNPDAPATLSVGVSGSGPISYQWRKGGTAVSGGTAASLSIAAAKAADAGTYSVVVTNPVGSVTSGTAVLTVNTPASITTQPVGKLVLVGGSVELKVVAAGSAPLNYQWSRDGITVNGATGAVYTIPSVKAVDAGSYTVVVSNMVNSVTSTGAVVQIGQAPAISEQPVSLTVNPGTLAVFNVTATGTGPLSYKWMKGATVVSTSTLSSYSIASAQTTHAGSYSVVVSNPLGSVTSGTATLAVNVGPLIGTQPTGGSVVFGGSQTFRVVATGSGPLSYQWYKGTELVSGATASTYTLTSARNEDAGAYTVQVTNMVGTVTSTAANLTVTDGPPVITANPVSTAVVIGVNGALTAKVRSTLKFDYKWSKDGTEIASGSLYSLASGSLAGSPAETTLSLGLLNPSALTVGTYKVTVSNAQGSVSSAEAVVTVFAQPRFVQATLVKAKINVNISAYNEKALPVWPTTSPSSLVLPSPANIVVPNNEILRLTVLPEGSLKYRWFFTGIGQTAGVELTSQTGSSLDFGAAGVNKGPGFYRCVASNGSISTKIDFQIKSFSAAVSGTEVEANGPPLEIVSEPVSVSASVGGAVVLGVEVTAGERSYAWFMTGADGVIVPVSTGGSVLLYLNPVQASDAGAYFVVVTDTLGNSVTSKTAIVTIVPAND